MVSHDDIGINDWFGLVFDLFHRVRLNDLLLHILKDLGLNPVDCSKVKSVCHWQRHGRLDHLALLDDWS